MDRGRLEYAQGRRGCGVGDGGGCWWGPMKKRPISVRTGKSSSEGAKFTPQTGLDLCSRSERGRIGQHKGDRNGTARKVLGANSTFIRSSRCSDEVWPGGIAVEGGSVCAMCRPQRYGDVPLHSQPTGCFSRGQLETIRAAGFAAAFAWPTAPSAPPKCVLRQFGLAKVHLPRHPVYE